MFSIYISYSNNTTGEKKFTKDSILEILDCLKGNLNSPFKFTRLLTLTILDKLNGYYVEQDRDKVSL